MEDRLIFNGVKTTSRLREKCRELELEVREKAKCRTKRDYADDDVVGRLYHYKELYDARRLEKQQKFAESVLSRIISVERQFCSLNKQYNIRCEKINISGKSWQAQSFGSQIHVPPATQSQIAPYRAVSRKAFHNPKEPPSERILKPKTICLAEEQEEPTFTPELNDRSRQIDVRNKENVPRWKYLHELKKYQMEEWELRERERQQREEEEIEKCTFRPVLIAEYKKHVVQSHSSERSNSGLSFNTEDYKKVDNEYYDSRRRNLVVSNREKGHMRRQRSKEMGDDDFRSAIKDIHKELLELNII